MKKIWFCVASGPSLNIEQLTLISLAKNSFPRRVGVLVVSDNYRALSSVDIVFSADRKWWNQYYDEVKVFHPDSKKLVLKGHRPRWASHKQIEEVPFGSEFPSKEPHILYHGGNSGQMAIDYLIKYEEPKEIVLVGYDFAFSNEEKKHWFGNHPKGVVAEVVPSIWLESIENQVKVFGKTKVWNATEETAIPKTTIKRIDLKKYVVDLIS